MSVQEMLEMFICIIKHAILLCDFFYLVLFYKKQQHKINYPKITRKKKKRNLKNKILEIITLDVLKCNTMDLAMSHKQIVYLLHVDHLIKHCQNSEAFAQNALLYIQETKTAAAKATVTTTQQSGCHCIESRLRINEQRVDLFANEIECIQQQIRSIAI